MSRTILTDVDGFYPVIKSVVRDVGGWPAMVFGCIWGYCQMKDGVCYASMSTIADDLGITRETLRIHIGLLVKKGYLKKIPGEPGRPNTYVDTGKAGMTARIWGGSVTEPLEENLPGVGGNSATPLAENLPGVGGNSATNILINKTSNIEINREESPIGISDTEPPEEYFDQLEVERKNGHPVTKAERRERVAQALSDGYGGRVSIADAIRDLFGLNLNPATKTGKDFIAWVKSRPPDETLQGFSEWWYSTDWRGKQRQPPNFNQIMELWPQAFHDYGGDGRSQGMHILDI